MKFNILDTAGGSVINTIVADLEFVEANFDYYEEYAQPTPALPTLSELARVWRDTELQNTDQASQTPDWPNRDNILLYRAALRSWPADADNFPTTRPELTT